MVLSLNASLQGNESSQKRPFISFPYPHLSYEPRFVQSVHSIIKRSSPQGRNPSDNSITWLRKAKPQTTSPWPPKLLNRGEVVRQVSHCGKPQRTGSQPLGCFLNLPEGLCPLGTPSEVSYLCTPWHTKCFQIFRKVHRTFLHIFHHFAKGLLAPCIPRQRFHPCNLVIIYYIQCNTLCNKWFATHCNILCLFCIYGGDTHA